MVFHSITNRLKMIVAFITFFIDLATFVWFKTNRSQQTAPSVQPPQAITNSSQPAVSQVDDVIQPAVSQVDNVVQPAQLPQITSPRVLFGIGDPILLRELRAELKRRNMQTFDEE